MSRAAHITPEQWDTVKKATGTTREIAAQTGISRSTVSAVRSGKRPRPTPGSKAPAATSGSTRSASATAGSASSSRRSTTEDASPKIAEGTSTVLTIDWKDESVEDVERISRGWAQRISAGRDERRVRMQIGRDIDTVRIPRRTYEFLAAIQKALLARLGGEAQVTRSERESAAEQTLTAGVAAGDDPESEDVTWYLALTSDAPPDVPMIHPPIDSGALIEPVKKPKKEPSRKPDAPGLLSTAEAENYLGVAPQTLANATAKGKIPVERNEQGHKRYRREDLDAWQASRSERSRKAAEGGRKSAALKWGKEAQIQADFDAGEAEGEFVGEHTEDISYKFEPDYRVAPGESLREIMEERKITETMMAMKTGLKLGGLRAILDGTGKITKEVAEKLWHATGVSADFWVNAEANYRKPLPKEEK